MKRAKGEQLSFKQHQETNSWGEIEEDAEYQGRKVKLNKPMPGDVKKTKVYVKNDKGNVVKVEFGDPNMDIKRDDPEREKKSFRNPDITVTIQVRSIKQDIGHVNFGVQNLYQI